MKKQKFMQLDRKLSLKEDEVDEDHDERKVDAEAVEVEPASAQIAHPAPPSCHII